MKALYVLKKNTIPILIETIFLILAITGIGKLLYMNFLFYSAIILFFAINKEIHIKKWLLSLTNKNS